MGNLKNLEDEKMDLKRTFRMLESLSWEHRIDINARIETLHNEELLEKSRNIDPIEK